MPSDKIDSHALHLILHDALLLKSSFPAGRSRLPSGHTSSSAAHRPLGSTRGKLLARGLGSLGFLVLDGLVNAQNQATGFRSGLNGVDLDETGLPHKGGHVISDTLVLEVNTGPDVALSVLNTKSVQDIGSVETSIVAKLSGNDLECLGEGLDDTLLLVGDLAIGESVKVFADFHLASTTTGNNALVLDGTLDDHDGIVQTALDFGNELFSTTTENKSAGLCAGAALEEVESLSTNLTLLEGLAGTEVGLVDIGTGRLDRGAGGLAHALHVV